MPHNLTVTIEDPLWAEMKKHADVRWSAVMKEAAREKLKALAVLHQLQARSKLTEEDIEAFSIKLGKKITKRK